MKCSSTELVVSKNKFFAVIKKNMSLIKCVSNEVSGLVMF